MCGGRGEGRKESFVVYFTFYFPSLSFLLDKVNLGEEGANLRVIVPVIIVACVFCVCDR